MDHCFEDEAVTARFAGKAKEELESTFVVKYCCKLAAVPPQEGPDMRVPMYNGACTRAYPSRVCEPRACTYTETETDNQPAEIYEKREV